MADASLAVRNARIYTAEASKPWAEALACRGERIVKLGTEGDVDPLVGPQSRVIDAGGRLVLPGFVDGHAHLIWGYELGTWIDLTGRPSLKEVRRRVADYGRSHPEEEILVGHGFDYVALQAQGMPSKEVLDDVVSDRPVLLTAYDGHTGWGNSRLVERALEVMGTARTEIGEMQRDARTGEPTGIFHRTFDLTPLLPEVQRRRSIAGLRKTISMATGFGITTAFDVQVNLEDLHAYEELRNAGDLTVRIRTALYHPEGTSGDRYPAFVKARDRHQDDWLAVGAIKLYIDGVLETGTGAVLEPYADNPQSLGESVYPMEAFRTIVTELDRLGFQICTHGIGDRGVRIALDAYEWAAGENGTSGRRHRIEHCETISAEDIPRFARLGVVPCMQPRHAAPELGARWRQAAGPERTRSGFPWRDLLDAGADLAFSSDWPVAELDPLVGIHEAVARLTHEGEPSPHRVSLAEAIDGYTRRGAFACHADATRGTLSEGKYADFVLLSHDLFEIPPERIRDARVEQTVVGGRVVYPESTKDSSHRRS